MSEKYKKAMNDIFVSEELKSKIMTAAEKNWISRNRLSQEQSFCATHHMPLALHCVLRQYQ